MAVMLWRSATRLGRHLRNWRPWVLFGLLLALCWAYRTELRPFSLVRDNVFDAYQQLDRVADNSGRVVIIDVDEKTIRAEGQWPWRRSVMADLTERLTVANARVRRSLRSAMTARRQLGIAHPCTPITRASRMPSS